MPGWGLNSQPLQQSELLPLDFFFFFKGPQVLSIEIPRLGVESELQLPAYVTATATPDLSLHHNLQQRWILKALSSARDQTCILMDTSWVVSAEPWWEPLQSDS